MTIINARGLSRESQLQWSTSIVVANFNPRLSSDTGLCMVYDWLGMGSMVMADDRRVFYCNIDHRDPVEMHDDGKSPVRRGGHSGIWGNPTDNSPRCVGC